MFKKILLTLAVALALVACNNTGHYRVVVTFADNTLDGDTAYLTSYDSGDTLATAPIADKFTVLEGDVDGSFTARLLVGGKRFAFIVENGEISIIWNDKKATGTPLNDRFFTLDAELDSIASKAEADSTLDVDRLLGNRFLKAYQDNRDNGIGPWALNYYLMLNNFSEAQIDSLLKDAPESYRSLKRVQKALNAAHQLEVTAVGKQFTDFANAKGERLSDHAGKGKYTIVDFWASWCGPCRREIATLKTLYGEYKDKINFVGIAVWDKPDDTKKAIEELQIPWPVIEDRQNWTEPTDLYGVSGIPHIMLIDPEGKIVARGLEGEKLLSTVRGLKL